MVDLSAELGGVYSAEHGTGKRKRNDFKKCYGEGAIEMVRQSKLAVDPDLLLNKGNIFKFWKWHESIRTERFFKTIK